MCIISTFAGTLSLRFQLHTQLFLIVCFRENRRLCNTLLYNRGIVESPWLIYRLLKSRWRKKKIGCYLKSHLSMPCLTQTQKLSLFRHEPELSISIIRPLVSKSSSLHKWKFPKIVFVSPFLTETLHEIIGCPIIHVYYLVYYLCIVDKRKK